ncbi:DUF2382 domain-containing protein [uncultured Jatrophihabitans sp.]|uniref:DUF2382 domain-containing protein n=1 Tax=uncultured Jatrophihabitans sp. TaxID=1610747 RepID=UPI0035CAA15F
MTNAQNLQELIGSTAIDSDGDKIGKIGGVYLDDQSGEPVWVTVSTGLFGSKESFAPLYGSQRDGENLRLAVDKAKVKDAPNVDVDGHLEESDNDALYEYYGNDSGRSGYVSNGDAQDHDVQDRNVQDRNVGSQNDTFASDPNVKARGHDTSGPNTDDAMTRSEERLHVGTENVETGRARLRKYIVTEDVTKTVPVSHEELRVEREPITDGNVGNATSGADLSEEEHEVTLHAEQAVVSKETVPVERVRLGSETVTEEQTVTEQVSKEQIDEPTADGGPATR